MRQERFPDGTPIDAWFYDTSVPTLAELGAQYRVTDYGILDDGRIHTEAMQGLIDRVFENGGGVVVIPKGTYRTGAI